jgi:predicted metalloendopeptidase
MSFRSYIVTFAVVLGTIPAVSKSSRSLEPAKSCVDVTGMDRSVAPGDDFNEYVNGAWLKATPIPPDKASRLLFQFYGRDGNRSQKT